MIPPLAILPLLVALLLRADRAPALRPVFHWLPLPVWCYAIPMALSTAGWLPAAHPLYPAITGWALPLALGLLLLGVDLRSMAQTGARALAAAAAGAAGVMLGTAVGVHLLARSLPPEAWRGAGALAGTWTGGTMNLLALRALLDTPQSMFAPLIMVDAIIAYGWMAVLVAASGAQPAVDRWLRAIPAAEDAAAEPLPASEPNGRDARGAGWELWAAVLLIGALTAVTRVLGERLPRFAFVASSAGWSVLLVTTAALAASLLAPLRHLAGGAARAGYPFLYLVLAATGAQAQAHALLAAPAWLLVGLIVVLIHAVVLLAAGRLLRLPLGILATASQANIGGVVSAPLVGAVYDRALAPVGLVLAMAGNALGTYLGLAAAALCRWLT